MRKLAAAAARGMAALALTALALFTMTATTFADKPTGGGPTDTSGSIKLLTCSNGYGVEASSSSDPVLKWSTSPLTYRIDNVSGLSSGVVSNVDAGVQKWNGVGGLYSLSSTTGPADIVIQLYFKITPGYILGATSVNCSGNTINGAQIQLGLKGLRTNGIIDLSAHEVGHALGLGHASKPKNDLMQAALDATEQKSLLCPSNLDVGALLATTTSSPFTVPTWQALAC